MITSAFKKLFQIVIPENLRTSLVWKLHDRRHRKFLHRLQADILQYYSQKPAITFEEKEAIDYLKSNPIAIFPYDFQKKYSKDKVEVCFDKEVGLRFVMHDGKKLYFKKSFSETKIRSLYHGLQLDQDENSPHLYLTDNFKVTEGEVIADIGAAEGNFSLSNVEKASKIYLFESDPEWIEALEATFKPWQDKVEIHNKFVSNTDSDETITIDTFAQMKNDISFFKVDIEGEESNFLEGAKKYLHSKSSLKMAICTYHKQEDEQKFTTILENNQFDVSPSRRYMLFFYDEHIRAPFLRRGLLRAQKYPHV